MTPNDVLRVFGIQSPSEPQKAMAKYLSECSRIETFLANWDGEHPDELPEKLEEVRQGEE